jgi:3-dehydroquinate synthase
VIFLPLDFRKGSAVSNKHVLKVELDARSYDIVVKAGLMNDGSTYLRPEIEDRKCLIITDTNVNGLYAEKIAEALKKSGAKDVSISFFPAGEMNKTIDTVKNLYSECISNSLDRSSLIVALGGGVPGDIAGFVAATYMRGIDFIQIPTTLLAMVDSSVGGKTGVDLPQGKNLVGAFWQPLLVMIDTSYLKTLAPKEILCGLAEIVKYAVIIDPELFEMLENNTERLKNLDMEFYSGIIARCCRLKAEVVSKDERENGLRAILNFGHTFGHAIEAVAGFSSGMTHGEAVAIGMCIASDIAVKTNMMSKASSSRIEKLMKSLGLKTSVKGFEPEKIFTAMGSDKKKKGSTINLVIPRKIGEVTITPDINKEIILTAIRNRCAY